MAKSKKQRESEADVARRKTVDAKNAQSATKEKAILDKLADVPLNAEERAFCLDIEPRMNNGRLREMPCSADILRYSKLKGRIGVVAKVEDNE